MGYFSRTWPHKEFINVPTVNPYDKLEILQGESEEIVFPIGEDLKTENPPKIYLRISTDNLKQKDKIIIKFNGKILENPLTIPGVLAYKVKPEDIIRGLNTFKISIPSDGDENVFITDVMVDINY